MFRKDKSETPGHRAGYQKDMSHKYKKKSHDTTGTTENIFWLQKKILYFDIKFV